MSFNPPARISDVDAEQPSTSTASGPRNGSGRGKITKFNFVSLVIMVPSCNPVLSMNHPPTPIANPPNPPGFPRTSTTNPWQSLQACTASANVLLTASGLKNALKLMYPISGRTFFDSNQK